MHDTRVVSGTQRVGHADQQLHHLAPGPGLLRPRFQRPAVDELHHQVIAAVVLASLVDGQDVRVIQRRDRADFLLEPPAAQPRIGGKVHLAHSAGPERRRDLEGSKARALRNRHGTR
jgi:hypothetical protein